MKAITLQTKRCIYCNSNYIKNNLLIGHVRADIDDKVVCILASHCNEECYQKSLNASVFNKSGHWSAGHLGHFRDWKESDGVELYTSYESRIKK